MSRSCQGCTKVKSATLRSSHAEHSTVQAIKGRIHLVWSSLIPSIDLSYGECRYTGHSQYQDTAQSAPLPQLCYPKFAGFPTWTAINQLWLAGQTNQDHILNHGQFNLQPWPVKELSFAFLSFGSKMQTYSYFVLARDLNLDPGKILTAVFRSS